MVYLLISSVFLLFFFTSLNMFQKVLNRVEKERDSALDNAENAIKVAENWQQKYNEERAISDYYLKALQDISKMVLLDPGMTSGSNAYSSSKKNSNPVKDDLLNMSDTEFANTKFKIKC